VPIDKPTRARGRAQARAHARGVKTDPPEKHSQADHQTTHSAGRAARPHG
jgi:hypothetical protein